MHTYPKAQITIKYEINYSDAKNDEEIAKDIKYAINKSENPSISDIDIWIIPEMKKI